MKYVMEHVPMSFLIATAVLMVTLFAAVLVAPQPFHDLSVRVDPCALEPREWGIIDPGCPNTPVEKPSWARNDSILDSRLG